MAYGDVDNQVQAYESKGLESLKQMQQSNPKLLAGIALENLQRDMQDRDRANNMSSGPAGPSVLDKKLGIASQPGLTSQQAISIAAPGLQAQGERMKAQELQRAMQPSAQMGAPNMAQMAGGGIVGYAEGKLVGGGLPTLGAVPPSPVGDLQIKQFADQYNALKAGAAAATTPEDKAQSQQLMQELIQGMGDQHGAVMQYIDSTKGLALPTSQMAKGGPVQRFQQGLSVEGDPLNQGDVLETGEAIVAVVAGPGGKVPVTEEEYVAFMETGQLPANRNDSRYSTPTLAAPLTAEETWLKRMDQMDRTISPIFGGETGLGADIKAVGNNPDFTWQEKVGGGYESGAEALGKLIGKTTGTAGITGEYLLRSLGLGAKGAGQTGVLGEGVDVVQEYIGEGIDTLREPSQLDKMEAAFNEQMAVLSDKLNELQNTALDIDLDPGGEKRAAAMAAIQGQMDQARAQYNSAVSQIPKTNLSRLQDEVKNYPQGILGAMQRYQDDPSSTMVGRFLGNQRAVYDEQAAKRTETARIANLNEASDLARQKEELASMSPEERFNQLFRQPENVAGAGQGQTSDQRQTQRLADAKTQFAIDNPEKKGIADLMQTDKAARILDVIRKLGYAGGASKGYEGQAIFQGIQAERDAEKKAGRDRDMLDAELDARFSLMREQELQRTRAAQGMGLAEYAATLDDNYIMNTEKYRTKKEELERAAGKGPMDTSWYGKGDKEGVERAMAIYAGELKAEMIAAYKAQLGAFNPTANQSAPVAPAVSSEGWEELKVTP